MTIKMNIGGIDVSVTDPAEAAALLRELQKQPKEPVTHVTHENKRNGANGSDSKPVDLDVAQTALALLTLVSSTRMALSTEQVMESLGLTSFNAVGGTTKKVNQLLADLGFEKKMTYRNPKRQNEPRYWLKGRQTDEAISVLKKLIEDQK